MNPIDPNVLESAQGLWAQISAMLWSLLEPFRLWQVAYIVGLLVLAWGVDRLIAPRLEAWLRSLEGLPKWQMRFLVIERKRMRGLIYVGLLWAAAFVIAQSTPFPSRRYLVEMAATIATPGC